MNSASSIWAPAWGERIVVAQLGKDVSIGLAGWFVDSAGIDTSRWALTPAASPRAVSTAGQGLVPPQDGISSSRAAVPTATPAQTDLGHRLKEIRQRIVASGEPLLDWDGLARELAERRGEA